MDTLEKMFAAFFGVVIVGIVILLTFATIELTTVGVKSECTPIRNSACIQCFNGKFETVKCSAIVDYRETRNNREPAER